MDASQADGVMVTSNKIISSFLGYSMTFSRE